MKIFSILIFYITIIGCNKTESILGTWKIELNLQNQTLPVIIHFDKLEKENLSGHLVNSKEKIILEGTFNNGKFQTQIGSNYAVLSGELKDGELKGNWIRTNKEDYKVEFKGVKTSLTSLYKAYESSNLPFNISGKWKVKLSEEKFGLGIFQQNGSRVQGSILTSTGDYRFLDGYIKGADLFFTGFDGVFSYIFKLKLIGKTFAGIMYAGKNYNNEISGNMDDSFKLEDPLLISSVTSNYIEKFDYKSLSGEPVNLNNEKYKGKVKIVQVFGSWCPNCHDETSFFLDWRKKYPAKLNQVEFIALAFENFKTEAEALKALRKFKVKEQLDYPIVLVDYNNTKKVSDFLPINNFKAFPTTLFLNKENKIVKIHTGFAGQATEIFFDQFVQMFNKTVDELIKE
jgi:thiol-disulfide isomerase/thioredoxin